MLLNQSSMEIRLTRVLIISPFLLFVVVVNRSFRVASAFPSPKHFRSSISDGNKIPVVLYYETLCPYCANFIANANGLNKVFDDGLISIIDLKLVPYGNAKIGANNTISCQHGPSECFLNTIEACAINAWPTVSEHFPLIHCIEKFVHAHEFTQWESCFDELGLESKHVYNCYRSGLGVELELGYAAETNALEPPHQYVPWVVVNGNPLYEDYENFESYICGAYSGTIVPEACSELSIDAIASKDSVQKHRVCYKDSFPFISQVKEAVASLMW
ncbi:hypothetical protein SAY86_013794 [Trapa natans]|uniref:Gamma-interferon-inducible lysosomal thiol reductase n=1 Tax=Trapa natans TaxID=22666 RepID=A0AAN7KV77_TRANT|nr:hypothetical protein SAY86_013794 [Trapa natans]